MNDIYSMIALNNIKNKASSSINEYGDDDWASPTTQGAKLSGMKLDLHGCSHTEVTDTIENILILQYNTGNWPLEVITGNSTQMKSLVIKHAYKRGFNTKSPINGNPGSIIVF
jgi:hypothetical protein